MEILIETCLNDLYLLMFNDKYKIVDKILVKNLKKKSNELPNLFIKLLKKNNIQISDINKIYVTKGPGSFMGIRAGLLFAQTIAGSLNKKIYACDTLKFLQTNDSKNVYIDAKGGYFYTLIDNKYKLKKGKYYETKINYDFIESNLKFFLSIFYIINPFENNSFYMKKPTIG